MDILAKISHELNYSVQKPSLSMKNRRIFPVLSRKREMEQKKLLSQHCYNIWKNVVV